MAARIQNDKRLQQLFEVSVQLEMMLDKRETPVSGRRLQSLQETYAMMAADRPAAEIAKNLRAVSESIRKEE